MSVRFTSNACAASYLPDPASVKDMTASFWLKFSTLPPNGTAQKRYTQGLMQAIYTAPDPNDDAYPMFAAIVAINDAFFTRFNGRPSVSVERGTHYFAWDITDVGNEIVIADGLWHHHCFVSKASSGALEWHIDGVMQRGADSQVIDSIAWTGDWRRGTFVSDVSVGTEGPDYDGALAAAAGIEIGSSAPDGPMAEVAIWNVALRASDIAKLVAGAPASLVRQNNLISYQRLFESSENFVAGADDVRSPDFALVDYVATVVNLASASHLVAMPPDAAEGHVALMIGTTFEHTFSTPAGWSLRETNTTDGEVSVLTKTLAPGDLAGVTVPCSGSTRGLWHVYVFSGAQRPAQVDLMETDLEVGERSTFWGSNVYKVMYARTRRTDNTLALDEAYDQTLSSVTSTNDASTGHGRLVTGYRGPEWDKITDAATATITGTTDGIRTGTYIISAASHESGMSDGVDIEDHPPAVVNYESEIRGVSTVGLKDTGAEKRKDPDAELDFVWSWSGWLAEGEIIKRVTMLSPEGIFVDPGETDGYRVFAWISGGVAGVVYPVVARITTNQGRTDDRTMNVFVLDR